MNNKYFRKDWILYDEIVNDGGKMPDGIKPTKVQTGDPEENKHVPFIIETDNGYLVKSGKNEYHATDESHKTMFIDLFVDDKYQYRQYIAFGEKPEAEFNVPKGNKVVAVAFCNLHGLFTNEFKK